MSHKPGSHWTPPSHGWPRADHLPSGVVMVVGPAARHMPRAQIAARHGGHPRLPLEDGQATGQPHAERSPAPHPPAGQHHAGREHHRHQQVAGWPHRWPHRWPQPPARPAQRHTAHSSAAYTPSSSPPASRASPAPADSSTTTLAAQTTTSTA